MSHFYKNHIMLRLDSMLTYCGRRVWDVNYAYTIGRLREIEQETGDNMMTARCLTCQCAFVATSRELLS